VTSLSAFDVMRKRGLPVRSPDLNWAVIDHSVASIPGRTAASYEPTRKRIEAFQTACKEFGISLYDVNDPEQGIVHVIAPELGIVLPGCTHVCADSHAATCGGLGAWAWAIGTTQVLQCVTSQMQIVEKPPTMRINFNGKIQAGVSAKDLILYLIWKHGVGGGNGYVLEYAGSAIRLLPIEGRMTVCNMSIEFGARSGLTAPDDSTIEYLAGRRFAPKGKAWDAAVAKWKALPTDPGAKFDKEIDVNVSDIRPVVTWGTTPEDGIFVDDLVPDPGRAEGKKKTAIENALKYMGLEPGKPIEGTPIDVAFIGSCTNGRLSDLEEAAKIAKGRKVPAGVRALVVPGSTQVKTAAEAKGLDKIFKEAGFEWRESSCSMCLSFNGDEVPPGKRSMSTSNRNFENRQGPESRTHLASPAMVAAAAVTGKITDVRKLSR
jgi:3-isopropylmalate/(R)-2-methylmalate dehydratase large subunit